MGLGNRVRELRRAREISQEALARRARISRYYLIQIEKHRAPQVSGEVMARLADALDEPLGAVFFSDSRSANGAVA